MYDNCGNVLRKKTYDFTLRDSLKLELMESTDDCYAYDGDKLLSYNNESCTYNSVGNPTIYRGKAVAWQYENRLVGYDTLTFAYDAFGRRISKGELTFTYDSEGRLVSQSNGLKFFYDHTGVAGFTYNNQTYFYMKSVQGDISALLDSTGGVLARYMYDAWGNHVVTDNSGVVIIDNNHVGNLNPFRYRGYYYDTETNFYYLKARYYDPVVGRFISMDDIAYLDPETINGLNLYAYGLNNPVMNVDPSGHFPWLILVAIMLFTPVGGMVAQATVSTLSYVGMAVGSIFDEHRRSQERLDVPLVVGEWGGQSEGTDWLYHINYLLDKFDGYQWGQTYWAYYDGLLDNPIMSCLIRTSPIAVCGDIISYGLDRESNKFSLEYNQDKHYDLPTEIYIHKTPERIECDAEYTVENISESDASILKIKSNPGKHKVTVYYQ